MPTKTIEDGPEHRHIENSLIGVKAAAAILVFVAAQAVAYGIMINGNSERDIKIAALNDKIARQEEAISRLTSEVVKVGRDTEWIRSYLTHKQNNPP